MSLAQRVVTLHPLLVSGAYIAAFGLAFATDSRRFAHALPLLIIVGWPLCLYIAARNAITPAPVHRFPTFATVMFGIAVAGSIANALLISGVAPTSIAVGGVVGAAFAIGIWASFFLAADALIKADTRLPWVADIGSTWGTAALIAFLPIGVWVLQPEFGAQWPPRKLFGGHAPC